jgi:tetratricopeptide (TPR) repeat protein
LLLKAEILKSNNKNAEALAVLEQAYTYAPFDVELSYQLAFTYAEVKNAKAVALADSLLRMDSSQTHAEPYYFKGLYYENTGNAAQAIRYYNEAIRHDYNFLDAYMNKGELLYRQKKIADAVKTFQLAVTISPTYADAYYWLGKCGEALGNKQEAKLNYQRAYGLDKSLTEAKQAAGRL